MVVHFVPTQKYSLDCTISTYAAFVMSTLELLKKNHEFYSVAAYVNCASILLWSVAYMQQWMILETSDCRVN